uniref:Uncharacterized protein n=1 Tax=Vespula pensylvanica TaxID=30213 RepID=A0A834UG20_VESPE|nr:hypothetical protein H0235_000033 [Vespula pensylvanica]
MATATLMVVIRERCRVSMSETRNVVRHATAILKQTTRMDSAAVTLAPIAAVATILSALHARVLAISLQGQTSLCEEKRATRIPRTDSTPSRPPTYPVVDLLPSLPTRVRRNHRDGRVLAF